MNIVLLWLPVILSGFVAGSLSLLYPRLWVSYAMYGLALLTCFVWQRLLKSGDDLITIAVTYDALFCLSCYGALLIGGTVLQAKGLVGVGFVCVGLYLLH